MYIPYPDEIKKEYSDDAKVMFQVLFSVWNDAGTSISNIILSVNSSQYLQVELDKNIIKNLQPGSARVPDPVYDWMLDENNTWFVLFGEAFFPKFLGYDSNSDGIADIYQEKDNPYLVNCKEEGYPELYAPGPQPGEYVINIKVYADNVDPYTYEYRIMLYQGDI